MTDTPTYSICKHFSSLVDPRVSRTRKHVFHEILIIALCAMICGADDFTAMADFGRARLEWFKTFLELTGGIPSHDTFGRVFARMDSAAFSACFYAWTEQLQKKTKGRIVALDGKRVRRSFDEATGKAAIHMVSAWTSANSLVLAQMAVGEKTNEITAIPVLLDLLDIQGSIVTIDAMGTQKEIAAKITDRGGDYVLALKQNHPSLHEDVRLFLESAHGDNFINAFGSPIAYSFHETRDKGHGRVETRRCWCSSSIDWLDGKSDWTGLRTVVMVDAERIVKDATTKERRFYISSLPANAKTILAAVRGHWRIENSVHWILDMSFDEDRSRARKDNAPRNLATLRHLTLNLLKMEKSEKRGTTRKRLRAAWDLNYLRKIILG